MFREEFQEMNMQYDWALERVDKRGRKYRTKVAHKHYFDLVIVLQEGSTDSVQRHEKVHDGFNAEEISCRESARVFVASKRRCAKTV